MKKSLKFCKNKTGFTLVELVITIAIVIILSVISVPIYRGYVDKAKWSEGYSIIGTILSAEKAYYSEYGNFYGTVSNGSWNWRTYDPVLGISIAENKYFNIRYGVYGNKEIFAIRLRIPDDLQRNEKTELGAKYTVGEGLTVFETNTYGASEL